MTKAEINDLIRLQTKSHRQALIVSLKRGGYISCPTSRKQPKTGEEPVYEESDHAAYKLGYYADEQLEPAKEAK